jgi:hypothetical protein
MPRTRTIRFATLLCLLSLTGGMADPQAASTGSTPAAATPTAANTATTACPAAFGAFGPLTSAAAAPGGTAGSTTPSISLTQTVGTPAKAATATVPPATTSPTQPAPPNTGAQPAKTTATRAKPTGKSKGGGQAAIVRPLTGIIRVDTNSGLSAADLAAAFSGKIPSVTSLVPVGPDSIFYTIDPTKLNATSGGGAGGGGSPTPDPTSAAREIEKNLRTLIGGANAGPSALPRVDVNLKVLKLPDGYGHACDVITAIGHQAQGVTSLSVVDDSRILAGLSYDPTDTSQVPLPQTNGSKKFKKLQELVDDLAVPTMAPVQPVTSQAVRLYYERDAMSVATVVGAAFSELKSSAISSSSAGAFNDTVVLADPAGKDEVINQARRMIAQLDEPRPQVTINAWSLQLSSDKQGAIDELVPQARRLAGEYNDALQRAILSGWSVLTKDVATRDSFLDPTFANYLCSATTYGRPADPAGAPVLHTKAITQGFCGSNDSSLYYGLGYTGLFDQSPPDLVRMLITVAAAKNPREAAEEVLDAMEGKPPGYSTRQPIAYTGCIDLDEQQLSGGLRTAEANRKEEGDIITLLRTGRAPSAIGFSCTRARLEELLNTTPTPAASSFIGQFRAAIADYLFQNKMKTEYPNDFEAFLYPASAAQLDATLTPIVDGFNQDLEVLQQHLQRQLTGNVSNNKHLSYTSNGLVTVKVVSGNQAQVTTQSQNYFAQNPTMKLENFASQLVQGVNTATTAQNSDSKATAAVPPPSALGGTLSTIIPAIAAYAAAQPAQVTAKVGSGLAMTVTPFTLSSASGAELAVNVTYNENAASMISSDATKSQPNDDLNSRVSEHAVTTMVRMDSLKFFEISTMQSVIARQKERWKPIDPVIELPLLDGLGYGIRRKPQVIYNQSEIFLEATIVPTAADLGNSLLMQNDQIEPSACVDKAETGYIEKTEHGYMEAHKPEDFCTAWTKGQNELYRIMDYHKSMLAYFSRQTIDQTGTIQPNPSLAFPTQAPPPVSSKNSN